MDKLHTDEVHSFWAHLANTVGMKEAKRVPRAEIRIEYLPSRNLENHH
jgi:hypothetical protein